MNWLDRVSMYVDIFAMQHFLTISFQEYVLKYHLITVRQVHVDVSSQENYVNFINKMISVCE